MAYTIGIEFYQLLQDKIGKEEGKKIAEAIDATINAIDKHVETYTLYRKVELKEELTKELVTKAEFYGENKLLRQEMQTLRQEMQTIKVELDRKFTTMFLVLFFTVIFLNQNALEFMFKVLGLLK